MLAVPLGLGVDELLLVCVALAVCDTEGVDVKLDVPDGLGLDVSDAVCDCVQDCEAVAEVLGVAVGLAVAVEDADWLMLGVSDWDGDAVALGDCVTDAD